MEKRDLLGSIRSMIQTAISTDIDDVGSSPHTLAIRTCMLPWVLTTVPGYMGKLREKCTISML